MINALTVDVEDYFQVSAFDPLIERGNWGLFESRVVRNTYRVLELCAREAVRGTFFVLGWVADRYPHLVKSIQRDGHEIGCHSYWHRRIYAQSPDQFRHDLRRARNVLEDIIGTPVDLYRAPSFSITRRSLWALDILIQEGFRIDSSIFPTAHDRYGIPGAPTSIYRVECASGEIVECALPVVSVAGRRWPASGGGYFRLYPFEASSALLRSINDNGLPFVFYIHPWELDPEQPVVPASLPCSFRHYHNLDRAEHKLARLLGAFHLDTLGGCVAERLFQGAPLPVTADLQRLTNRNLAAGEAA